MNAPLGCVEGGGWRRSVPQLLIHYNLQYSDMSVLCGSLALFWLFFVAFLHQ